jgi:tripartite-type tricarboxylate transporter receptor subunit TctC
MKRQIDRRSVLQGAAALIATGPTSVGAQQIYGGKTVKLVTGFQTGTPADMIGRVIAPPLAERLGGSFIIDPHPGAGERVAMQLVAAAPADGTTLLIMTGSQAVVSATDRHLSYDMVRDFRYVSMLVRYPLMIVVSSGSKFRTLADLTDTARGTPEKLSYGSAGVGTITHLAMELFCRQAGIKMTNVPYSGGTRTAMDLENGGIDCWVTVLTSAQGLISSGALRVLAVSTRERDPLLPDVPPMSDTVPDYDVATWLALAAPAGTPDPMIDRLHDALAKILVEPDAQARARALGLSPAPNTPSEMQARVAADLAKWRPFAALVDEANK